MRRPPCQAPETCSSPPTYGSGYHPAYRRPGGSLLTDTLQIIGRTIADKYAVESVVGEGGFATVYRAQHVTWKRPVALKVFKALGDFSEKDDGSLPDGVLGSIH